MTQCDFLCMLAQLKIFHWSTKSFSAHKAFGKTYEALDELVDTFVESWQGLYGKMAVGSPSEREPLSMDDKVLSAFFMEWSDFFLIDIPRHINTDTDKDLLNLRDEMLGCLSRLRYLLTLG